MSKKKKIFIYVGILAFLAIAFIGGRKKPIDYESLEGFENLITLREADESNFVEANENMFNLLKQVWKKHGYYTYTISEDAREKEKKADVAMAAGSKNSDISFIYSYDNLTSYMYEDTGYSYLSVFIDNVKCGDNGENFTFEDDVIKDSINLYTGLINKELQEAEEDINLEKISESFKKSYVSHSKKEEVVLHTFRKGIEIKGIVETSYDNKKEEYVHGLRLTFAIRSYSHPKTKNRF